MGKTLCDRHRDSVALFDEWLWRCLLKGFGGSLLSLVLEFGLHDAELLLEEARDGSTTSSTPAALVRM